MNNDKMRKMLLIPAALFSIYLLYLLVDLSSYQFPNSDDYCYTNGIQKTNYYHAWNIFYRFFYNILINISFQFSSLKKWSFSYLPYICMFFFTLTLFLSSFYIFPKKSMNLIQRMILMSPFLFGLLYILDDLKVHQEVIFWFSSSILYGGGALMGFSWNDHFVLRWLDRKIYSYRGE